MIGVLSSATLLKAAAILGITFLYMHAYLHLYVFLCLHSFHRIIWLLFDFVGASGIGLGAFGEFTKKFANLKKGDGCFS